MNEEDEDVSPVKHGDLTASHVSLCGTNPSKNALLTENHETTCHPLIFLGIQTGEGLSGNALHVPYKRLEVLSLEEIL